MFMFRLHLWPHSGTSLIKDTLQKHQEQMHKYKIVRFKMYGLKIC